MIFEVSYAVTVLVLLTVNLEGYSNSFVIFEVSYALINSKSVRLLLFLKL